MEISKRDGTIGNVCADCYWSGWNRAPTHYETRERTSQCRRFPPTKHREWATICKYDGCGEWKQREDSDG